jgi:hypothetical protein
MRAFDHTYECVVIRAGHGAACSVVVDLLPGQRWP